MLARAGPGENADVILRSILSVRFGRDEWDEVIEALKKLPKLKYIGVWNSDLSDKALDNLGVLNVESIWFVNTNITKQQAIELKEALPDARINAGHDEFYPGTNVFKDSIVDFELR